MPKPTRASTKTAKLTLSPSGISRSQAEKFLAKVPEKNAFWCKDGSLLRDLKDLKDVLAIMSDQTFAYHSNEIRKDFSNWVKNVTGDEKLARELEKASNREEAAKIVEDRYKYLQKL
jgi:hypothetical protein